jgi:hypothetical protein
MFASAMIAFCNVDGNMARDVIPFPHNPNYSLPQVSKWEKISYRERLAQISSDLSLDKIASLESFLLHTSGGTLDNTGVFDILRWWALSGYKPSGINEYGLTYKLRNGQSSLAKAIFSEALATGKLYYKFSSPIKSIKDTGATVEVTIRDGFIVCRKYYDLHNSLECSGRYPI